MNKDRILCSEGQLEYAEFYCICKFPLPAFCEKHDKEHRLKDPGFHFTLPLTAIHAIQTKHTFFQAREWLNHLNFNIAALKEKFEEFTQSEERIEATYQDVQQHAIEVRMRLKEEFAVVKAAFKATIDSAVNETSIHALESYVPMNPFSHLLWFSDPGYIAALQIYGFQANYMKESLDSAFQVTLRFAIPGFEHLTIGQSVQLPSQYIPDLMQALVLKDDGHNQELDELKKALEDATIINVESTKTQQRLESAIQELQHQLQGVQGQLQELRNDAAEKELRCSTLKKENLNLATQVRAKEDQLTAASRKIAALEQRCSAMDKQVKEQGEASSARSKIAPVPTTRLEKLIGVRAEQVRCFDVATSQLQQFCKLDRKINVDSDTSSTFIAPNKIFACGGGERPCILHLVNRAYMLEEDGSVQELPRMSSGRNCPGIAWDSTRKALYVFGGCGFWGYGTWFRGCQRTCEMFLSNEWSPLADMHQYRSHFNPCWHLNLLYLCGGHFTNSVETYDPRSNTYVLQDFILPEETQTTAVMEDGVLTVISENYISKLQQGRLTSQPHSEYFTWSNSTPVVNGGTVYVIILRQYCYRCINSTTGKLQKEFT